MNKEAKPHRVIRISTRPNGLGYCSICGKPALGFANGQKRHVSEQEQMERRRKTKDAEQKP